MKLFLSCAGNFPVSKLKKKKTKKNQKTPPQKNKKKQTKVGICTKTVCHFDDGLCHT
jgi:hypothetical protein